MAQGITFDLKARVTGYESSLAQLKRAFDKIDPGSEIGKKLSKAIQDAENKLKSLNKNLNPKATNDNQIDSIIEKTNTAAEAIQNVAKLMQNVSGSDVDFSSFNNGIKELVQQLNGLQEELEDKISGGLKSLISDSNDLSEALKDLGINVEDKDRGQIFVELQNKAEEAAEKTKVAVEELQKAQNDLSKEQIKLTNLESNPLNNRDAIKKDLSNLTSEYTKAIEEIKNQVGNNLTSLLQGDSGKAEEIMNAFMNGLTPETLSAHLKTLKDTLQSELKNGMSAKDIYKALLGDYGNAGNAQAIATKLIQAFDFPGLKEQFRQKIYEISSELTDKETGQLLQFIKESDFQAAEDKTIRLMESHAVKLQGAITKAKQAVKKAAEEVSTKEEAKVAAEITESSINTIISTLQTEIENLSNENVTLKEDIKNLQEQIAKEKSNVVNDISGTGGKAEIDTESFKISTEEASKYHHELDQVRAKEQLVGKIEGVVQRWFSIYAAVRMVNNAIHSIISTVRELDKTITEIAIVTNMTQDDLWGQMSDYTEMARQYAASISGVYEVSQLYYQQGLQTADVMALTEETLKMARISGLGYAEATDYMTNAVRSFKMEMTDAQRVVDVYSEIAASSATSTTELATAMSKTASSAEAVGSSFENTTAMMAVMIEATRESATNIGSAMKSIISRYGEMTSDPSKLIDSEGEEMSLNKVDKALQSVGITIQDTNHQFREFDDVIAELAGKWDTIDNNTQRYIATVMAGNRQQSRFLALVSNGERLAELSEKAADAEDAATLQVLKTMDSIEAKMQQLQTSLQSLYTSTGVQNFFKGILDVGNNVINTFTKMPTTFNLPILAVTKFGTQFLSLANIVTTVFSIIKSRLSATEQALLNETQTSVANNANIRVNSEQAATDSIIAIWETMPLHFKAIQQQLTNQVKEAAATRREIELKEAEISNNRSNINAKTGFQAKMGLGLNIAGAAISMLSSNMGTATNGARVLKGSLEGIGSALQGIGMAMALGGGPFGIIIGALTVIPGLINGINTMIETAEEKTERLAKAATEANNAYIQQHNATKTLQEQIDKLEELEKAQYDSEEARQAFIDASNEMAEQHPELISAIDSEGNAIVDLQQSYLLLAEARDKAADAAKNAAIANNEQAVNAEEEVRNNYREKARIEIGNFNDRIIESRQKSYEEELSDFVTKKGININDNFSYTDLVGRIRANAITGNDQNDIFTYLAGQGVTIDDKEVHKEAFDLFNSIGEKISQGIEAVDPSNDLKMGDYLADAVKDSEFLSSIVTAMDSENNVDELQKIFSGEDFASKLEFVKQEFEKSEDTYVKELIEYVSQLYKDLLPEEAKIKQAENKTEAVRRSDIAKFVGSELSFNDSSYLKEMNNASSFITEAVYESSQSTENYEEFIKTIPDKVEVLNEQLSEIWKNLTPSEKDNFNTLIASAGHYNKDNFKELLNQYIKDDEELSNAIIANLYNKVYNVDDFKNAVQNLDTDLELNAYNDLLNQLGSEDLLYILDIYKNVDKQIQNKTISQKRGNEIIGAYMSLFETASSFGDDFAEASQLISGMSDFSLSGITKFQESVNNSGLSEERMKELNETAEKLKGLIPINLNTEINTFVSSVTAGMSDFESALNKATKGMNYKDAAEIAGKMGVSVSSFRQVGTKFFIDDLDKLKDAYIKVDESLLTLVDNEINSVGKALESVLPKETNNGKVASTSNLNSDAFKFSLSNALEKNNINIDVEQLDISTKYQEWLKIADKTEQTFSQYVVESLTSDIEEAKKVEEFVNTQIAENYLASGNFSKFLEYLNLSDEERNSYQKDFNQGNFEKLSNIFPQYADTIVKTFKEIGTDLLNRITSESDYDNYVEIDSNNAAAIEELVNSGLATYITDKNGSNIGAKLVELTEANIDKYNEAINKLPLTPSEKAKEAANATKALYENSSDKMIEEIIKNNSSVSAEIFETMRQRFIGIYGEELGNERIKELFKNNRDGTYSIDLTQIQNLIEQGSFEVTNEVKELLANNINNIISSITGLVGSQSKGYTNLADMQKFVNNLNKISSDSKYRFQDIFEYSDILHAYQLSTQGIIAQIQTMKNQLSNMTEEQQEVANRLIADTARQFAEQIDISGYLSLDDTDPAKAIKEQEVMLAIHNYNLAVEAIGEGTVLYTEQIMNSLKEGGLNAIKAARQVAEAAGKTLTADEVEAAYRSEASQLTAAFEQLVYEPGTIIDNTTADILEQADFGIKKIEGTNQALITKVGDINKAYEHYLNELRNSGEATLVDLNEATAIFLETNESEKTEIIETLSKAASMTYSEFANVLTKAGIELTEGMINQLEEADIIRKLGGGKMQIIDFKSFADLMDWDIDANNEEYISAFKAYNDALIELNRKTEKAITDEIKSISESKAGDQVNLTQLSVELGDAFLAEIVDKYGGYLNEGILTLGNDANIPALIREIAQEAANKGLLLEDTIADLADTLNDVLQKYTDLINNGIAGQLTNVEAQQLQTQANSLGFKEKLDFKETANGLKLSEQSAASLYNHLKSVDVIQSHLVLDKLYDSIISSEGKLKTMSETMVTINNLQKKITKNEEDIAELRSNGNYGRANQIEKENNKLKDQLQLYKDIRMEQMDDSDAYSFMDKDLPNSFKAPQNYWNSVGKAFTAINQAGENGYMEIADFYNFINEATNLVQMSGQSIDLWGMQIDGSAETAANLIEKGFGALSNIDGEGVKIDLTRLGVDFSKGADGMADGFTTGIKSLAKSQIALIDAEIAMLETFVAMEALGDIDVDKNGVFDFTAKELGTLDEQGEYIEHFGTGYKNTVDKIKKYFENSNNKDIQNAYKNFKINGHSIEELLNASEKQLKEWGIKGKTLQTLLQKFYELSQSDEFSTDPGEIWKQIAEALSGEDLADLDITFYSPEIGQVTIENGNKFGIDFESATAVAAKEFLKEHGKNGEDLNKELEEAFEKYQAGTSNEVELTAVLMAKGIVETKDDGLYVDNEGPFKNEEDPKYKEAIAKAALKDIGITGDIEYDAGTGTATGKYRIGTREIVATSKDGKTTYYSDMDGANPSGYDTPEKLMQAEYKLTMESIPENQQYSENEFRHERYGYKLEIEATLETKIDEEGLKTQAIEALSKPANFVKACIEDPNNENYNIISANDKTITYDLNGIIVTVDNTGSLDEQVAAAQEQISRIVDPDGLILKISTGIQNAFQNLNIAQLFIDGLTTSLQVHSENGTIQFTSNPTITALGANLGQGIAAGIASASGNSIKSFFGNDSNISTITTPIQEGVEGAASSATVTDTQYEIPHATATLKKMDINQVEAASLSSSTLGGLLKTVSSIFGGSSSDLTLESATAAIKKLSVQSVGETDLQTQIQTEIVAKVGSVDVSSIITAQQEIVNAIGNISNTFVILKNQIADLSTNSINANASISNLKTSLIDVANSQGPAQVAVFKDYLNAIDSSGPNRAFSFKEAVNAIASYGPSYAADFVRSVNNMQSKTVQLRGRLSLDAYINTYGDVSVSANAHTNASFAKGNVGIKNNSPKGKNKTLMGELGPELVVSNGRYYVVGENGAEMVDLPDDAIVFNHLQTKKLLSNGKGGRGTPVTNEKNAVSYATGNVSGPALVSAKQAIASLKQLRAMWQAMLTASAKQLGSQAGKTINKPKAGKDNGDNGEEEEEENYNDGIKIKTTTAEIQRWYNLLRQIAKTEKDITFEEKLQSEYQSLRVADGKSLYESYKAELSMLEDQVSRSKELAKIQKSWYDVKRAELAASAYGKIFTYTADGLQQYVDGRDRGLDILEKLTASDIYGNPIGYATTAATQLSYLESLGFNLGDLFSNSDGTKVAGAYYGINSIKDENGEWLEGQDLINAQVSIMENFWDNLDGWRDELDGLYDSYREQLTNVIDNQNKQNEIMQKVVDNQIEVENKVYDALVDARQAIIDNAQKEMETYQKNTDDMIDSLNKTLDKERQLYDNQKNSDDLLKLQRQLAILQRSGGSTSQIVNLQQQIATKQQDMYFEDKEAQIKALQEASNLQLKKMQEQIDLMTETLEYQKQNGLLWEEIATIMRRDPQDILGFITDNSADWNSQSALQISQSIADLQTKIEVYTNSRDEDFISYYNDISSNIKDIAGTTTSISKGIHAAGTTSNGYVYGVRNVYKEGGLIDFTGPAWVDGTPSQPEAVLNANETKFVQNKLPNILNSADTLQERVKDLQNLQTDWLSNISNIINNNDQNNSVNIEHVELNMKVEQMSSSADAKKLGREAFDELLNMARKTGKNSVSRR